MPLTGNQRRYLRGLAHHRDAIVQVGHQGVTDAVVRQLDRALDDHELVKVRLAQAVDDRAAAAIALAEGTAGDLVQLMGRTVVIYRRHKKKPVIELPRPHGEPTRLTPASRRRAEEDGGDESEADDEDADDEA